MNFVEGTRFTPTKHAKQNSPYRHLLKPRSGGISYVLSVMGQNMRKVIDVAIVYPDGVETLWKFFRSAKTRIVVKLSIVPIPSSLLGREPDDPAYKDRFNQWLNDLWTKKDEKIGQILNS